MTSPATTISRRPRIGELAAGEHERGEGEGLAGDEPLELGEPIGRSS